LKLFVSDNEGECFPSIQAIVKPDIMCQINSNDVCFFYSIIKCSGWFDRECTLRKKTLYVRQEK
jgi:hypothetical protein